MVLPKRRNNLHISILPGNCSVAMPTTEVEADTRASALLLKHEFLDGGADDVTLATLGKVLLEPTLTTLGNFLVRSNSRAPWAWPASRWEASSWRATP